MFDIKFQYMNNDLEEKKLIFVLELTQFNEIN